MNSRFLPHLTIFICALASACHKEPFKPAFAVAHSYVMRGQVVQTIEKGKPYSAFMVSHEALPGFYDAEGTEVGMESMTMPFPCSDPGKLSGLKVGDKIQMTVVVSKDLLQWDIAEIHTLPADTPLKLAR